MKENFKLAFNFTMQSEGGYVNDPKDLGGETYRGISRRFNPQWSGWSLIDKKDFKAADAFVEEFYFNNYWRNNGCNDLAFPLDICVFDTAVLCGSKRAKQWIVESNQDWRRYLEQRMVFHLSSKQERFKKGWVNRVNNLKAYIQEISYEKR